MFLVLGAFAGSMIAFLTVSHYDYVLFVPLYGIFDPIVDLGATRYQEETMRASNQHT